MKERSNTHVDAQRGEEARQVLANPAYIEAMAMLHQSIVDEWQKCPVRDVEGQRLLLQLKKVANKFEDTLAGMVEAGKLAQNKLSMDNERDENGIRRAMRRVL